MDEIIQNSLEAEFPNDTNGDVLRRMKKSGMDFNRAYDIDFEHVFPSEVQANDMAQAASKQGHRAVVGPSYSEGSWDCRVIVHLKPTHQAITAAEESLGKMAAQNGGQSDGWGILDTQGK